MPVALFHRTGPGDLPRFAEIGLGFAVLAEVHQHEAEVVARDPEVGVALAEEHELAGDDLAHERLGGRELTSPDQEVEVDLQGFERGQGVGREVDARILVSGPGELLGFQGLVQLRGVGRGLMRGLDDEPVELRRGLAKLRADRPGALEGFAGLPFGFREVPLAVAERREREEPLGDVGVAGQLGDRLEHGYRQGQQLAGPRVILDAQAGLGREVAGLGEFAGRASRVLFAHLRGALEQRQFLGELLPLAVMEAEVGEGVAEQRAGRHRRLFGQRHGLEQQGFGLEVVARRSQRQRQVHDRVDDDRRLVAAREPAHVEPHPVELDRLRELPLRPQVRRVGMHHVVERRPVAELRRLQRLFEVRLGRGHVAGPGRGQGVLQELDRVWLGHDPVIMASRPPPARKGRRPNVTTRCRLH